jgi:hypothetical protein
MARSVAPLQVEHPTRLLRLQVLFVSKRLEGLGELRRAAVVDAVRLADERHDDVAVRGLV